MFSRKFWDKEKTKEFPNIKDWTDPQNHLRFSKDVKGMNWKTWYWFHPSAYLLMIYGSLIITFLIFVGVLILLLFKNLVFLAFIDGVILFSVGREIVKKIVIYKTIKDMNHYDMYLREFPKK